MRLTEPALSGRFGAGSGRWVSTLVDWNLRHTVERLYPEQVGHVPQGPIRSLEATHGLPRDDAQSTDTREFGGEHLGHAVCEVLVFRQRGLFVPQGLDLQLQGIALLPDFRGHALFARAEHQAPRPRVQRLDASDSSAA